MPDWVSSPWTNGSSRKTGGESGCARSTVTEMNAAGGQKRKRTMLRKRRQSNRFITKKMTSNL